MYLNQPLHNTTPLSLNLHISNIHCHVSSPLPKISSINFVVANILYHATHVSPTYFLTITQPHISINHILIRHTIVTWVTYYQSTAFLQFVSITHISQSITYSYFISVAQPTYLSLSTCLRLIPLSQPSYLHQLCPDFIFLLFISITQLFYLIQLTLHT